MCHTFAHCTFADVVVIWCTSSLMTCILWYLMCFLTCLALSYSLQPMAIQQLQQPIGTVSSTTGVNQSSGDNYKTLSVVMTILVLILGGWPSVMCTMAALMISYNVIVDPNVPLIIHIIHMQTISPFLLQARDEERHGNIAAARTKANISLGLNIAAVVFTMVVWSVVAIPVAVTVSAAKSATIPPTSSTYTLPTPAYCYTTTSPLYYCQSTYCSYTPNYSCSYSSYSSYSDSYNSYSYYTYYITYYYYLYCYSNYYIACYYG